MHSLSQKQRTLIAIILMLSAISWICIAMRDSVGQLGNAIHSFGPYPIAMSLIPIMAAIFITAYIYFLILSRIVPFSLSARNVVLSFIGSQVVRYLPGKVWSIFYQMQTISKPIPARHILIANFEHLMIINLNSIAVAATLFIYYYQGVAMTFLVVPFMLLLILFVLRLSIFERVFYVASNRLNIVKGPFEGDINMHEKKFSILALLQLEWIFYFMSCYLILPGHFSVEEVFIAASLYAVAWIVGALSIVIPGGLFVREASFLWLASLFISNTTELLAFSIIMRVVFTIAEVISAGLGMVIFKLIFRDRHI